jgi:uncharacterized protein with beta-barrel porin domain
MTSNQWNTAGALSSLTQSGPSLAPLQLTVNAGRTRSTRGVQSAVGEAYPSVQSTLIAGSSQLFNVLNQRMTQAFDNDVMLISPLAMSFAQQRDAENNGVWGQTFGSAG